MRDFARRAARLLPDREIGPVLELVRGGVLPQPGTTARALFNLTDAPHPLPPAPPGATESLLFSSEAARYHGGRKDLRSVVTLMPYECVVFGPAGWATYG